MLILFANCTNKIFQPRKKPSFSKIFQYESKTRGLGHLEKNSEKCPAITIEKEKGISTNVNLSNISLTNGNEIKA